MPVPMPGSVGPTAESLEQFRRAIEQQPTMSPPPLMYEQVQDLVAAFVQRDYELTLRWHRFCDQHFDGRLPTVLLVPRSPEYGDVEWINGTRIVQADVDTLYALFDVPM